VELAGTVSGTGRLQLRLGHEDGAELDGNMAAIGDGGRSRAEGLERAQQWRWLRQDQDGGVGLSRRQGPWGTGLHPAIVYRGV